MTQYLDHADFLTIAELVLGERAEDIAQVSRLELAESALHAPLPRAVGSSSTQGSEQRQRFSAPIW